VSPFEETLSPPISEAAEKVLAEVKSHAFLQRRVTGAPTWSGFNTAMRVPR
jgi:hypothetical protein